MSPSEISAPSCWSPPSGPDLELLDPDPERVLEQRAGRAGGHEIVALEQDPVVARPLDQVALLVVVGDQPNSLASADRFHRSVPCLRHRPPNGESGVSKRRCQRGAGAASGAAAGRAGRERAMTTPPMAMAPPTRAATGGISPSTNQPITIAIAGTR